MQHRLAIMRPPLRPLESLFSRTLGLPPSSRFLLVDLTLHQTAGSGSHGGHSTGTCELLCGPALRPYQTRAGSYREGGDSGQHLGNVLL